MEELIGKLREIADVLVSVCSELDALIVGLSAVEEKPEPVKKPLGSGPLNPDTCPHETVQTFETAGSGRERRVCVDCGKEL